MKAPLAANASAIRRAAGLMLICAVIAAIAVSDTMHAATVYFVGEISALLSAHPLLGGILFVLFAAASAMLAFVSAAVAVPVAVYSLGQPVTAALMWLGWVLGGACAYGVGRYLGRPVVGMFVGNAALGRFEHRLHARTPFAVVLLLQLALPSELPGYLLGMLHYPLSRYLLALAIVELPYAAATTYLGASFLQRHVVTIVGLGALGVIVSVWALALLRRKLGSTGQAAGSHEA